MATQRTSFQNQDYKKTKKKCLESGELFYDDFFRLDVPNAMWLRPKNIIADPRFFVGGVSRFDVVQGANSGCWLIVAMANLTMNPSLFEHVVPKDQTFLVDYAGIFRFNIWQCGRWVEVVVDDRLPTKDGKLMFVRSTQKNEFWSALLEKAYAKLYGSYSELTSGWFNEAMVDFTGGIVERVTLSPIPRNLEAIIRKALEKSSFMCIFMKDDTSVKEMITAQGLVKGHAYSINKSQTVQSRDGSRTFLIRLRNPWGKIEWNGAWSDSSTEWASIPSDEKNKIGLVSENDGEFWMSLSDLSTNFEHIDICHLSPDTYTGTDSSKKIGWEANYFKGDWIKNSSAGGFYSDSFYINPQYRVTLTDADDGVDNVCTVLIGLMQRNKSRQVWHKIGFTAFYLEGPEKQSKKPLTKEYIKRNFENSSSSQFKRHREVVVRDTWKPGVYCIMPSTYEPYEEGQFLLRFFSERKVLMEEQETATEIEDTLLSSYPSKESEAAHVIEPSEPTQEIKRVQRPKRRKILQKSEQQISLFFQKTAGEEHEIGWQGLQSILEYAMTSSYGSSSTANAGIVSIVISYVLSFFSGSSQKNTFTKDECRSMIAILDDDHSGKLSFREFQVLWKKLQDWESVFLNYSKGTSNMNATDLNKAIKLAGYQVNTSSVNRLIRKYSDYNGELGFGEFVMCVIEIFNTDNT